MSHRNIIESAAYMAVVLAAVLACGKDDASSGAKGADDKPVDIGETVTFEDSEWKVTKAEDKGDKMKCLTEEKKTDGRYIVVEFNVKNTTKKEESIIAPPKLKDSEGREFGQWDQTMLCLPQGKESMILEQLPSTMTKSFMAIYEVPKDAKGLRFMARELAFSAGEKPVNLNL